MTAHPLPRLGRVILDRLADRNEPLAGDIVEGYRFNQSTLWFWRQIGGAILNGSFRKDEEFRRIRLVEFPSWQAPAEDYAAKRLRLQAGLSAGPVQGVGGLTIVASVMLISVLQPLLWAMLAAGLICGVAIGLVRVRRGRRHPSKPGAGLTAIGLSGYSMR